MTLPSSGPLSLTQIQTEFGGPTPIQLGNYYRGGAYVPNTNTNASDPTTGAIGITSFYGASTFGFYTPATMNGSATVARMLSVTVSSSGLFVAVGWNSSGYPVYATSSNGSTWTTPAAMNGSTTAADLTVNLLPEN
jgi:hypothetical protein